jgi:predicted nucleic acid-binding protein
MNVKTFVDSNVLIYAHDSDSGLKRQQAAEHLTELWQSGMGLLSTQVLQEFYVNVTCKIGTPLPASKAREVVRDYATWVESPTTAATVARASEIAEIWQVSFWDAMILAAAEQNRANRLLTEDLNAGQIIAGIEIVNPFRDPATGWR